MVNKPRPTAFPSRLVKTWRKAKHLQVRARRMHQKRERRDPEEAQAEHRWKISPLHEVGDSLHRLPRICKSKKGPNSYQLRGDRSELVSPCWTRPSSALYRIATSMTLKTTSGIQSTRSSPQATARGSLDQYAWRKWAKKQSAKNTPPSRPSKMTCSWWGATLSSTTELTTP